VTQCEIYSVAFSAHGKSVATAGAYGMVRLVNVINGTLLKEFHSVPVATGAIAQASPIWGTTATKTAEPALTRESLPDGARVVELEIQPSAIKFAGPNDYAQLLVTARLESGDTADVTRLV